jgi:hypothetical protein
MVSALPDEGERNLCVRLIAEIEERAKRPNIGLWTFQSISDWLGVAASDEQLQRCVQFLASRNDGRLLDMHFLLFNPDNPDDTGEPIEDDEVREALRDGFLIDPESGKEIQNFEKFLAPYFVPSDALKAK